MSYFSRLFLFAGLLAVCLIAEKMYKKWSQPGFLLKGERLFAGDYMTFTDPQYNLGKGDVTIALWIKTVDRRPQMLVQKGGMNGADEPQYWLRINDFHGGLTFLTGDGDGHSAILSTADQLADGKWHHIVAVRQGPALRLYVDGYLKGEAIFPIKDCTTQQPLILGAQLNNFPHFAFEGAMEEVGIWPWAASLEEVKSLMAQTGADCL
ncbi:MAG: LamG domain-containing protein [Bacteroidota bacterium]